MIEIIELRALTFAALLMASHVAAASCPSKSVVQQLAASAWGIDAARIEITACARGRFPAKGWAVAADVKADTWGAFHRLSVVTDTATVLAIEDGVTTKEQLLSVGEVEQVDVTDFDGDGIDEIVATVSSGYKYEASTRVVEVHALRGNVFQTLLRRGFHYEASISHDGSGGDLLCDGQIEVTPRHELVIRGRIVQPLDKFPSEKPECVDGVEVYADDGGGLRRLAQGAPRMTH